jgi:hypothetical protein
MFSLSKRPAVICGALSSLPSEDVDVADIPEDAEKDPDNEYYLGEHLIFPADVEQDTEDD